MIVKHLEMTEYTLKRRKQNLLTKQNGYLVNRISFSKPTVSPD